MRILLLMDNRGDRNWGSQATTKALVRLLEARFPGATIDGAPRDVTAPSKTWRSRTEEWAPVAMRRNYRGFRDRFALGLLTRSWEERYEAADLVVLNGEGTLHPQRQTRRWLPAIDFLQRRHGKPFWVVNSTISLEGSDEAWQFERVLRRAERIVVRDAISHRELAEQGIESIPAADCAYLTEPRPTKRPNGRYAVLTGTSAMRQWPAEFFRTAFEKLRTLGLEVVYTASDRLDFDLPARMGVEIPILTDREVGPEELMDLQAGAEILIGGRYHPTILAALSGTPFVSLTSNTTKTQALMDALESRELLVEPGAGHDALTDQIEAVLKDRAAWSSRLKEAAAAQIPLARRNVFD